MNRIAAALVLAAGQTIDLAHLPDWAHGAPMPAPPAPQRSISPADQRQRDELVALLKEHRGNVSSIARAMGKARMQIQRWLKRYGLDPESYRQ